MRKKQQKPEQVVQVLEDTGEDSTNSTTTRRNKRKRTGADLQAIKPGDIISTASRTTRSSYKRSLLVEAEISPGFPDPPCLLVAPAPPMSPPPVLKPVSPPSVKEPVSPPQLPLISPSKTDTVCPPQLSLISPSETEPVSPPQLPLISPSETEPVFPPQLPLILSSKTDIVSPPQLPLILPSKTQIVSPPQLPLISPSKTDTVSPPQLPLISPSKTDTVSPPQLPLSLPSSSAPLSVTVPTPTNVILDEPQTLKSTYQVSDKILCYFNGLLYDAVILDIKSVEEHAVIASESEIPIKFRSFAINFGEKTDDLTSELDQFVYFIHYRQWNCNWDEWVRSDCLKSITDESRKEQLKLKSSAKKAKKAKTKTTRKKRKYHGHGKSGASRTDFENMANEDFSGAESSAATTPAPSPSRLDQNTDSIEDCPEQNNVAPVPAPVADADVAVVVGLKTVDHIPVCEESQESDNAPSFESNMSSLSPNKEVEVVQLVHEVETKPKIIQPFVISSGGVAAVVVHSDQPKPSEPNSLGEQYILRFELASRH